MKKMKATSRRFGSTCGNCGDVIQPGEGFRMTLMQGPIHWPVLEKCSLAIKKLHRDAGIQS